MARITQRECSFAALFRREIQFVVNVVWGFVCDYQRDLRETLEFLLYILIEYSHVNILPQITQITQRNAAELHYFAEKDMLELV